MSKNIELRYVMDPHCGWCFGFGKVLLQLFIHYQDNPSVYFDIIPGGLFYPKITIDEGFSENKRPIAKRIEELAGVQFSENYFSNVLKKGSFLDSEPPARAMHCIKKINRKLLVPFTEKLLEKEFLYGENNSLDSTIFKTVREFPIDEQAFQTRYHSETIAQEVLAEFQKAQGMTTGFPTLFLTQGKQSSKLAGGYAPLERLVKKIETFIQ